MKYFWNNNNDLNNHQKININNYNFHKDNYSNNNIISSNYKTYNNVIKYKTINNSNYKHLYNTMFQTKKKIYINRNNYSSKNRHKTLQFSNIYKTLKGKNCIMNKIGNYDNLSMNINNYYFNLIPKQKLLKNDN